MKRNGLAGRDFESFSNLATHLVDWMRDEAGGARCVDQTCSAPVVHACHQQAKVCADGQCVVECTATADCKALGYPAIFTCHANASRPQL